MELRKDGNAFVLMMILLYAFAIGSTWGMRWRKEMLFGNDCSEINEEIAQLAWIHYRKALISKNNCFKGFCFYLPKGETTNSKSIYSCESFCIRPSSLKQELVNCLRKKNIVSPLVQWDIPKSCFTMCFGFICYFPNAHTRFLAGESHEQIVISSVPYLVPKLAIKSRKYSLSTPTSSTSSYPLPHPFFQRKLQQNQPSSHARKLQKHQAADNIEREIFIAVVATAATTFFFVASLFCCWLCFRSSEYRTGPRIGQRDDRPLLHLSGLSASSSQNSSSLRRSSFKEYNLNSEMSNSFKSNLSTKNGNFDPSVVEVPSSTFSAGGAFPPLKPPPGRRVPQALQGPQAPQVLQASQAPQAPQVSQAPQAPPPPEPPPAPPPKPPPAPPSNHRPPPPPPKVGRAPPAPPPKASIKPSPPAPHPRGGTGSGLKDDNNSSGPSKTKLKPFFWDKVMASPDQSMVWHEISAGSFQFNEEMMESLFGYNAATKNKNDRKRSSSESSIQFIQIIDARKAQNLSILLRALNVTTEEVIDALREGTELPSELLSTLLKMTLTSEEELKLRLYTGDLMLLGPAERFLKVLVEIPFAFKRMESLLFMSSFPEEVSTIKESFIALEIASDKLQNSRLFLKLLEAVLKTGNRMNDGTYRGGAMAFKLDTLLKLSDVKGTDGKTTLLHFVVQEIIRSEGIRAVRIARNQSVSSTKSEDLVEESNQSLEHYRNLGLKVVSGLSTELRDVKKAAAVDADGLASTVTKLKQSLTKTKAFLDTEMKPLDEDSKFYSTLTSFADHADSEISWILEEQKRIMAVVQRTADYFHGNAGKNEGIHLFSIVGDFLVMLDKACKEVKDVRETTPTKTSKKETPSPSTSLENRQQSDNNRQRLFPAIEERRIDYSSSDDES